MRWLLLSLLLAQDELRGVVQQLREERAAYYERHRAREEKIRQTRAAIAKLESRLIELRSREAHVERERLRLHTEVAQLRKDVESSRTLEANLKPMLEESIRKWRASVQSGVPCRQAERESRLRAASLGHVWGFVQEELRMARSGETYTASIPLSKDQIVPARLFRVGHQVLGYMTEDGTRVGLWGPTGWRHDLSPEEQQAVRRAIETLDRRRAPEVIGLPVLK
jgi:hypothetical protein